MSDIHTRINQLRAGKKLSMQALADACEVTWQTVQQWEKVDGTAPKRSRLARVAKALGTTPEYLMTGAYPRTDHTIQQPKTEEFAPYRHPNKQIAEAVALLEATDAIGVAMAIGAIKTVLSGHHP